MSPSRARAARRLAIAALALLVVGLALLAGSVAAEAAGRAREQAAAAMRERLGPATGAAPDRDAVLDAWEVAGARVGWVCHHLAANTGPGSLDPALLLAGDLCGADLSPPGDVPEPGDLLVYREPAAAAGRWRVGMLTGPASAVIPAPGGHRLIEVRRGLLLDELSTDPGPRLAQPGTVRLCRLSAALLPSPDTPPPAAGAGRRRIALLDAPEAVRALQWELDHPRDADTGALHRLGHIVLTPLALVAGGVATVLGGGARLLGGLLEAAGPAPAVALWHLLGTSFDGRLVHAVLTDMLEGPALLLLEHLPGTGWMTVPAHAVASFTVSLLTGVDDSRHVLVGGVVLALACDLLVVARPLGVAARIGAAAAGGLEPAGTGATALRRTLDLSNRAGDLMSGRPSALLRLGGTIGRHGRVHDLLDAASLAVRPASLPGHLIELSGRLARWSRTVAEGGAPATPSAHALAAALHHLGPDALHEVERLAELSHYHSGGRTLAAIGFDGLHPFDAGGSPGPAPIRLPVPER